MCVYFYQNHIYNTVHLRNLLIVIIVSCSVLYLKQKTTSWFCWKPNASTWEVRTTWFETPSGYASKRYMSPKFPEGGEGFVSWPTDYTESPTETLASRTYWLFAWMNWKERLLCCSINSAVSQNNPMCLRIDELNWENNTRSVWNSHYY